MTFADSGRAIGAVTQLLHDRLLVGPLGLADVTVGRPEPPAGGAAAPRLNLFLYEVHFDGFMRNHALDEGQPGGLVKVTTGSEFEVDKDIDLEVVYVPPQPDQDAPALGDALNVFETLRIVHAPLEQAGQVGARAHELLVAAGVGRLDLSPDH